MLRVRILLGVATLAAVAAACTAGQAEIDLAGNQPASSTSQAADSDRDLAPDFTLALGNGGTFVLSEESRPVYLVFWAEW